MIESNIMRKILICFYEKKRTGINNKRWANKRKNRVNIRILPTFLSFGSHRLIFQHHSNIQPVYMELTSFYL